MPRKDHKSLRTVQDAHRVGARSLAERGIAGADLDSEVLLRYAMGIDRTAFFLSAGKPLPEAAWEIFQGWVERRTRREPVAYILGMREFWGMEFRVTPEVLIPRPETELLVETALRLMKPPHLLYPSPPEGEGQGGGDVVSILDLGTGSGCIAVSLAKEFPDAVLWAVDPSAGALRIAAENAARHGVEERIHFLQGDGFEPLRGRVPEWSLDAIVSNPPYIPTPDLGNLPPDVRDFEPVTALDGGGDGLVFYRRILAEGPSFLKTGGFLFLEVGHDQAERVKRMMDDHPRMEWVETGKDLAGIDRVVVGVKR
ncbi:MAG: peptide chain release factor N(5)-glutamine methyltransferase [Nitrospirae bacterium]|nr:peptide chain release factor N(5)-glutamine methyltransferase [Nitrospirota bacterium]